MFKKITGELRGIRDELSAVGESFRIASEALQSPGVHEGVTAQLGELTRRVETVAGEVAAGILRAEAFKATALAAEDRARGHMKRGERAYELAQSVEGGEEEDPFEAAARAYADLGGAGNGVDQPGLPALPYPMAGPSEGREAAKAAKRRR